MEIPPETLPQPNDNEEIRSNVSESCFQEDYCGASRQWLMRDGANKRSNADIHSTMKDEYRYPWPDTQKIIGERRAQLLQRLYDEAAEEIIRERSQPPPVEKYCTEYDGSFNRIEIPEEDLSAKKELCKKYPLYTSPVMSYWNYKIAESQRSAVSLVGLTASKDLKNPFRKSSHFTKPISEVLDETSL